MGARGHTGQIPANKGKRFITDKRIHLLTFIHEFTEEHGYAPSHAQMGHAQKCSRAMIYRMLLVLKELALIETSFVVGAYLIQGKPRLTQKGLEVIGA